MYSVHIQRWANLRMSMSHPPRSLTFEFIRGNTFDVVPRPRPCIVVIVSAHMELKKIMITLQFKY